MDDTIGATSTTVASASAHDMALVTVAHCPVANADTALVAVPVHTPQSFWTLCDKCQFQFEYEFKYRDLLMKCSQCSSPFVAKEISVNYKVARAANKLVRGDGVFMKSGDKRKMKELMIKPPGADDKAAQDECFENPSEPDPIPKKASPEYVVEELKKIPDLSRDDFLKAFNIIRHDHEMYRVLVRFPVESKKDWLLVKIRKRMMM